MNEVSIWMTYDLGVGGDFRGLYSWFDDHEAIECGNNIAYFKYKYADSIHTDKEFANSLKQDLSKNIKFTPSNRIYIVRKSIEKGNTIGTFIVGKRKANPWEGFGTKPDNTIDA
ncbi:hypothetical protein AGMMS50239_26740 [Bacteroidia bacterium]|nr:hypothetical protein AGMMS50239_26740 [Bacteroidia bacterium]